jgi:hypothetical protein
MVTSVAVLLLQDAARRIAEEEQGCRPFVGPRALNRAFGRCHDGGVISPLDPDDRAHDAEPDGDAEALSDEPTPERAAIDLAPDVPVADALDQERTVDDPEEEWEH